MQFIYAIVFILAAIIIIAAMNNRRQSGRNVYDPFKYNQEKTSASSSGGRTRLSAGKYIVGEDIPSGKFDFVLISGEGRFKYRDKVSESYVADIEFGFASIKQSTRYRNLVCEVGGEILIDGSLILEVRHATKTHVD